MREFVSTAYCRRAVKRVANCHRWGNINLGKCDERSVAQATGAVERHANLAKLLFFKPSNATIPTLHIALWREQLCGSFDAPAPVKISVRLFFFNYLKKQDEHPLNLWRVDARSVRVLSTEKCDVYKVRCAGGDLNSWQVHLCTCEMTGTVFVPPCFLSELSVWFVI